MRFHLVTAVWGKEHTELFVNTVLPNLLTSGNLLCFRAGPNSIYKIFTTTKDAKTISTSPFFENLNLIMPTEVIMIDDLLTFKKQDVNISLLILAQCHRIAVKSASDDNAALIFIFPDAVWSEGAFPRIKEIAESGKRVIAVASLRLVKETFLPIFHEKFSDSGGFLRPSPRELTKLALNHLHPITKSYFIDSSNFNNSPTQINWQVDRGGILSRNLHLHTVMVNPRIKSARLLGAFDTDYILNACPDYRDYYVVQDSDELVAFELSEIDKTVGSMEPSRFALSKFAQFALTNGNRIHRKFLREAVCIHSDNLSPEWNVVRNKSEKTIFQVTLLMKIMPLLSLWKKLGF